MKKDIIENLVKRIKQLPTLPTIVTTLKDVVKQPSSSAETVAEIIEKDQSLSSKVLRIVNSVYYSPSKEITGIKPAVSMVGFNEISNMVLAVSVFESLKGEGSLGFNRKGFWIHSLGCATFSQFIAKEIGYSKPDNAFTAGLLHDIGKIILDRFLINEMIMIQEVLRDQPMLFYEAERQVLGLDHALLGEWLLTNWKIPTMICSAVRHHHQAFSEREGLSDSKDLIVDIVHMADVFTCNLKIGDSGNRAPIKLNNEHAQRISLDAEVIASIIEKGKEQIEKDSSLFS